MTSHSQEVDANNIYSEFI